MGGTSSFIKRMNDYKKCMRLLNCANYVYLEEIKKFEFKKISKYNKSKHLYNKITKDFKLVNKLIDEQDLLNAATILRTLYENIIYIVATSYDKTININLDIHPKQLRQILEDNCSTLFTEYFEADDFNEVYRSLCKIVHPSSMKELLSYMNNTIKYKKYLLSNLKYIMLIIEYMYLNFLNKKVGNEESKLDLNFINLSTYVNLMNVTFFINDVKNSKSFIKKYFYYDTNNKYVTENQERFKEVYDMLLRNKEFVEQDLKDLTKALDIQIKESKFELEINKILNEE